MLARLVVALVVIAPAAALAQSPAASAPPPRPCQAPEHRQFDFWIGRWDVFTPDGKKAGVNHIEAIDGGCALIERWQGGGGFTGTSLNSWDAVTQRWHQHWVDNQGGLLRLAGAWDGQRMRLAASGPGPGGTTVQQRITWTAAADGSVRQLWERSTDGGTAWSVVFDGTYKRR
jgi:hypothetical protein